MRKVTDARGYLESHRHLRPSIAEELDDIYRLGAIPRFENVESTGVDEGFPRNSRKSLEIVQGLWKDVRAGEVFISDLAAIPDEGRLEWLPTHTVLKRNPDRTWSGEFRIISDLRRSNNWMSKNDTFPVLAPDIKHVIEWVATLRGKYPGFKVLLAKRDISNAFKRV